MPFSFIIVKSTMLSKGGSAPTAATAGGGAPTVVDSVYADYIEYSCQAVLCRGCSCRRCHPPPPRNTCPLPQSFPWKYCRRAQQDTAGCDPARLHEYLSDADFQKTFGMSFADFAKLPGWKQADAKKKHRLF